MRGDIVCYTLATMLLKLKTQRHGFKVFFRVLGSQRRKASQLHSQELPACT